MKWKCAIGTVQGSSHKRIGLENQDHAAIALGPKEFGSIAVVAVSDGHGGARHFRSAVGSSLAAEMAATMVRDFVVRLADPALDRPPQPGELTDLERQIVERWMAAVQSDLQNNPFTPEELAALETPENGNARETVEHNPSVAYGATVLVVAATDSFLLYLQLGDGDILAVDAAGETTRPLPEDVRLIANQTTSLCQPEAWREFRATVCTDPKRFPALVLVSSDGYGNSFRTDSDFLQIGRDYLGIIREQGLDVVEEDLPGILAEASQHGSGDDITLGILQGDITQSASVTEAAAVPEDVPAAAAPAPPSSAPAAKPPKPSKSDEARASKTARYEQLKLKQSAQARELKKLAAEHQKAKKKLQSLKIGLAVAVVAVAGIVAAVYWRSPSLLQAGDPSHPPVTRGDKGRTGASTPEPGVRNPKDANPADSGQQFVLQFGSSDSRRSIILAKGKPISLQDVTQASQDSPTKPYAEVAEDKSGLVLINRSEDPWKVTVLGKKAKTVGLGGSVVLAGGTNIVFRKGVSGTIAANQPALPSQP